MSAAPAYTTRRPATPNAAGAVPVVAAGGTSLAHQRLRRAEDILSELLHTLDHERGGEIAANLAGIYTFCLAELGRARVEQDPDRVDWTQRQLTELRDSWAQIAAA